MNTQKIRYNALVDWRFDGSLFVNGEYVHDVAYMDKVFDHLKNLGFKAITLDTNVPIDVNSGNIQTIAFFAADGTSIIGGEDRSLPRHTWDVVNLAKKKGLEVDLRLNIVNINNDFNITKGLIGNQFSDQAFFSGVTAYEKNIALKAQQYGVSRIYVGVNQDGFDTAEYRDEWQNLISELKTVFSGTLLYQGFAYNNNNVVFELVDEIAVTFGPPNLPNKTASPLELVASLENFLVAVTETSQHYDKPITLASVRFPALEGMNIWTEFLNGRSLDGFVPDHETQTARFTAFFNALSYQSGEFINRVDIQQYAPWQDAMIHYFINPDIPKQPSSKAWYLYSILDDNLRASPKAEAVISQFINEPWGFKTFFRGTSQDDHIIGTNYNDYFVASLGLDTVSAGIGNDVLLYRQTKTHFDGGKGWDEVQVEDIKSDFTILRNERGLPELRENNSGYYVTLENIERVKYSNFYVDALDIEGNAGQSYRLYQAALDRTPDTNGLAGWIKFMDDGGSLIAMSQQFIDSGEFKAKYGALNDRSFVNQLYLNVLDRNGEASGVDGWVNGLANGLTRAQVLAGFSESAENKVNVLGQIENGISYVEWWLST